MVVLCVDVVFRFWGETFYLSAAQTGMQTIFDECLYASTHTPCILINIWQIYIWYLQFMHLSSIICRLRAKQITNFSLFENCIWRNHITVSTYLNTEIVEMAMPLLKCIDTIQRRNLVNLKNNPPKLSHTTYLNGVCLLKYVKWTEKMRLNIFLFKQFQSNLF